MPSFKYLKAFLYLSRLLKGYCRYLYSKIINKFKIIFKLNIINNLYYFKLGLFSYS